MGCRMRRLDGFWIAFMRWIRFKQAVCFLQVVVRQLTWLVVDMIPEAPSFEFA